MGKGMITLVSSATFEMHNLMKEQRGHPAKSGDAALAWPWTVQYPLLYPLVTGWYHFSLWHSPCQNSLWWYHHNETIDFVVEPVYSDPVTTLVFTSIFSSSPPSSRPLSQPKACRRSALSTAPPLCHCSSWAVASPLLTSSPSQKTLWWARPLLSVTYTIITPLPTLWFTVWGTRRSRMPLPDTMGRNIS